MERRRASSGGDVEALYLDDDEPDAEAEAMLFVPKTQEDLVFDLPDVLPDFGGAVANLLWNGGGEAVGETDRPIWDLTSALTNVGRPRGESTRRERRSRAPTNAADITGQASPSPGPEGSSRPTPKAKILPAKASSPPPVAPPAVKPAGPPAIQPAAKPPGPPAKGKGKGKGPPPPPKAAKGKGKGKPGKGKPPPPKKPPSKATAPPAKVAGGGGGGAPQGKAALFAAISKGGGGLKKVGPPKERSGAPAGRVL